MSHLSLTLPDSIHRYLQRAAAVDGISVNQFINLAVAEKLSALETYQPVEIVTSDEILMRKAQ